jgi:HAD superfamily hydrolase (TIGR01457 family)
MMHNFIKQKKVFLFDLDGTLYLGKKVLPGARRLVQYLRKEGREVFFYTNNSSRSEADYIKKLNKMGFCAKREEIIMSTHTVITYLKAKRWRKIFLLGTPSMKRMLSKSGIKTEQKKPQVVVVGFDQTLTYKKLEDATRLIDSGVPFILAHPDTFCPTEKGRQPDCASIGALLETATDKKPLVALGKPHALMLKEVMKRTRIKRKDMVLVGDRLSTDIQMGKKFGIQTILVLSGETKKADLKKSKLKPNLVMSSVADLLT